MRRASKPTKNAQMAESSCLNIKHKANKLDIFQISIIYFPKSKRPTSSAVSYRNNHMKNHPQISMDIAVIKISKA